MTRKIPKNGLRTPFAHFSCSYFFSLPSRGAMSNPSCEHRDEMKAVIYLSIALLLMVYISCTSSLPRNLLLAATSSKIMSSRDDADAEHAHQEHNNIIKKYTTIEFEVFGRVQGVFFRKHTKAKAEELGLTGWCRNTPRGTVQGEFEYAEKETTDVDNQTDKESWEAMAFQHWLCRIGSPRSQIDECRFSDKLVSSSGARKYDTFRVIR